MNNPTHRCHLVYINLDRRTDRRAEIEAELLAQGLQGERFAAVDSSSLGEAGFNGCAESHLAVLRLAKARGYARVCILEDDFTFLTAMPVLPDTQWDVCMLSYNMIQDAEVPNSLAFRRVIEAQTASGYVVAAHYLDTLIALYEKYNPLLKESGANWLYANDQVWKRLQRRDMWVYCVERVGKQRASWSDTGGFFVDCGV